MKKTYYRAHLSDMDIDDQEYLIQQLYYPEQEDDTGLGRYTPSYSNRYSEVDYDDYYSILLGDPAGVYDDLYDEDEIDDDLRLFYEDSDLFGDGQEDGQDKESSCDTYAAVPAGGGAPT